LLSIHAFWVNQQRKTYNNDNVFNLKNDQKSPKRLLSLKKKGKVVKFFKKSTEYIFGGEFVCLKIWWLFYLP
jgi:hypothetical protein